MGRFSGTGGPSGHSRPVTSCRQPGSGGSVRISRSIRSCGLLSFSGPVRAIGSGGLRVVVSETTAAAGTEQGSLLTRPPAITAEIHGATTPRRLAHRRPPHADDGNYRLALRFEASGLLDSVLLPLGEACLDPPGVRPLLCQRPSCGPRWWPVKSPHPSAKPLPRVSPSAEPPSFSATAAT